MIALKYNATDIEKRHFWGFFLKPEKFWQVLLGFRKEGENIETLIVEIQFLSMSYQLMPKSNVVSSCEIVSKMFSRAEQNQHLYIFELHPTLHYCTDFFFSFFCWKDFQNTNDFHRAEKTLIKTQTKICISIKYLKVFMIGLSLFFFYQTH